MELYVKLFTGVIFRKKFLRVDFDAYMAMAMDGIKVEEVMSKNPLIVSGELSVREGARILKKRGVSTIIIEEEGNPIGIVTDRDLVTKILAENMDPDKTKLRDIMSNPIVMIPHNENVADAARVMSRRKIRKLPVVKDGKIIGILSENDIVKISPDLIALTKEYSEMYSNGISNDIEMEYVAGKCEMCGQYSLRLIPHEGMLICPECYDSLR